MPCLSKVPGKASAKKSGSSSKYYTGNFGTGDANKKNDNVEVSRLSDNILCVNKGGQLYTLTLTDKATTEDVQKWGNRIGVENILDYMK